MTGWIDLIVPDQEIAFPHVCPSCLSSRDLIGVQVRVAGAPRETEYSVPFCGKCGARMAHKWSRLEKYGGLSVGWIFCASLGVALYSIDVLGPLLYFAYLGGISLGAAWLLRFPRRPLRISSLGDESVHFGLRSSEYARRFLDANPKAFEPERGWKWARRADKVK